MAETKMASAAAAAAAPDLLQSLLLSALIAILCAAGFFCVRPSALAKVRVMARKQQQQQQLKKEKQKPPAIRGIFMLGNALQLTEKPLQEVLTAWAQLYGPIFTIRAGWQTLAVISSPDLAKEAIIVQHNSVASKMVSTPISILTCQKSALVVAEHGEHYRTLKKLFFTHLLGPGPQKEMQVLREEALYKVLDDIFAAINGTPDYVDVRHYTKQALLSLVMNQIIGRNPDAFFVEEWGRYVPAMEMLDIFVTEPLGIAAEFDWRDFFPLFKWVPNRAMENKVNDLVRRRTTLIRAITEEERKLLANGKGRNCFLHTLLSAGLPAKDVETCTWELIGEGTDTSLVTIEWAMFELARNPAIQERLYQEVRDVVGEGIVTEDHLPKLKYLNAVVKETLRLYPPAPVLLPRIVSRDMQLGGYDICKGWQILVNVYGINNDPKVWPNPGVWDPGRLVAMEGLDMGYQDYRILSFSAGKRMCAGVLQAMTVISMSIALYVQHFRWGLPPGENASNVPGENVSNVPVATSFTLRRLRPLVAVAAPRVSRRLNA